MPAIPVLVSKHPLRKLICVVRLLAFQTTTALVRAGAGFRRNKKETKWILLNILRKFNVNLYFLDYFPRVPLISDCTYPRVQYEGRNKPSAGSINVSLAWHAPSKCTWLTSLHSTNTRYVQCSTACEYRPARQAIRVVQVVLVARNEYGCVTMQELFKGGVNFLQLLWALAFRVNSKEVKEIQ